ncbi:hypothetical protein EJ04DRAFT_507739 [Polyplosphaeria fusca]|uniref:Uncharacterized protein n=1 Tax=Polyplosphaeria fusca TaxID=682080 RepID=A0A9P4V8L3_9PLEO|nr:hypothetical protein EJ04DRAFT_507739 [Polyplosphaeria fusca]
MRRPRLLHIAAAFALVAIVSIFSQHPKAVSLYRNPATGGTSYLHLLVTATSSDLNLCRLLLSAAVLQYPPPVLIDWEGENEFNAAETHLAKIHGPLRYLESLPESQNDDLVLIVDGFDVLFQVGPDVMLRRYFAEVGASNARLASQYRGFDVHNNILFGPDKMCFPLDFSQPRCWAVPESPLSRHAFGPDTDVDMQRARPRWLNSGTIMGPLKDLRTLFQATRNKIDQTFDLANPQHNSDQMYLADVWADQEYARVFSRDGVVHDPMPQMATDVERALPVLEEGQQTDFHVTLDYSSSLFQTTAGYYDHLTWTSFNRSSTQASQKSSEAWKLDLPEDLSHSPNPFAAIGDENTTWSGVSLGVNTITSNVFPVLHFTGDKSYRDRWWKRMWYFPKAKDLLKGSVSLSIEEIGNEPIGGISWRKHGFLESAGRDLSGARSDQGERLSWDGLCKEHENAMYSGVAPSN